MCEVGTCATLAHIEQAMKSVYRSRYRELLALLKRERQRRQLTQDDVAAVIGWDRSAYSKMETGERRIDLIEFLDIVEVLGVDPCKLIKELGTTQPRRKGGEKRGEKRGQEPFLGLPRLRIVAPKLNLLIILSIHLSLPKGLPLSTLYFKASISSSVCGVLTNFK